MDISDDNDAAYNLLKISPEDRARWAAQRAADLADGRARFGFLESPCYLESYVRAARVLVDQAQETDSFKELAVACCYLQRHALELALKALISSFHEIAHGADEIARKTKEKRASTAPPQEEVKRLTETHDLRKLFDDLQAAYQREAGAGNSYPVLPDQLEHLVEDLRKLEDGRPERFRYATVKRTVKTTEGKKTVHEPSFDIMLEIALPIGSIQSRLEALIHELFDGDGSLGGELCLVGCGQDQELYYMEKRKEQSHTLG